jgi:hypothetical protein
VDEANARAWAVFERTGIALAAAHSSLERETLQEGTEELASLIAMLQRCQSGGGLAARPLIDRRTAIGRVADSRVLPDGLESDMRRLLFDVSRLVAQDGVAPARQAREDHATVVVLPAALLFQARRSLVPPERMMVGSGRRVDGISVIESLYDVTGKANEGHCEADPVKLMAAFVEMEHTGSDFGLWAHSHPGECRGCTVPSDEDLTNYAVRFFGASASRISVVGSGVMEIDSEAHVYEFAA